MNRWTRAPSESLCVLLIVSCAWEADTIIPTVEVDKPRFRAVNPPGVQPGWGPALLPPSPVGLSADLAIRTAWARPRQSVVSSPACMCLRSLF